jgi:hypothetical protein
MLYFPSWIINHVVPVLSFYSLVPLYLSPVETYCMNIDYYIPDEDGVTADFTSDETAKLRK